MAANWVHGNVLFAGHVVEVREVFSAGKSIKRQSLGWEGKLTVAGCEFTTTKRHTTQAGAEDAVCEACHRLVQACNEECPPVEAPATVAEQVDKVNGWTVPDWMKKFSEEKKVAILNGDDDRCPEYFVKQFEAGHVPADEPPGLEERAYMMWRVAGGQIVPPKPVTADDL